MTSQTVDPAVLRSSRKILVLIVLCGSVGVACARAAGVGAADVPSITVKYDPRMLETDAGARAMYRRLVKAAETVCPAASTGSRLPSSAVELCRRQALARAVHQIDDPRLAAVSGSGEKSG